MNDFESPEEKIVKTNENIETDSKNGIESDVKPDTYNENIDTHSEASDSIDSDLKKSESAEDDDSDKAEENTAESENEDSNDSDTYDYEVAKNVKGKLSDIKKKIVSDNKKSMFKNIMILVIILIVAALIFFDYIPILPNAYHRSYVGNTYTVGQTQSSDFAKFDKSVLYASNGTVMCFGPDMSLQNKISAYSGVPNIRTNGSYAVIYYSNSKNVLYISGQQNYKKYQATDTVIGASVNKNGYYTLVTNESGYNACLTAYDKNHKSFYKWHTNFDIIDSAVALDGKHIVAAVLDYSDSGVCSKLIFFDTTETKPIKEVRCENNIVSEVCYFDNDNFIAFGNSYTSGFNSVGTQKWRIDYSGKNLKTYDIDTDGEFGLVFNKYNSDLSDSTVEIYNSDGNRKGIYNSKNNVRYISANNGYYLLSLDKETVLLNSGGIVKKVKETNSDFQKAVLYKNYNFAFSVTDSVATVMSVKH